MKLTMLGTGNAKVTECYNTCFLLSDAGRYFLVDGGGGNGILRVNVTNLRKKIEQDSSNPLYLFTENGVGYRIAESRAEK